MYYSKTKDGASKCTCFYVDILIPYVKIKEFYKVSEIVEQNALRLKITDAEESGSLRDEMSYETAMRGIQDRARTLCSMGDKCCLNVVTTDFIPNESAIVVVGCDNRECPSPRVVEETALNRVPDQGQSVEVTPLLAIS